MSSFENLFPKPKFWWGISNKSFKNLLWPNLQLDQVFTFSPRIFPLELEQWSQVPQLSESSETRTNSNLVWIYLKDVKLYPLSNCLQYKLSQSYIHLHLVILNRNKGFWGGERSFTSFVRLGFNIVTTLGLDREVFQLESFWFWQRLRSFTDCLTKLTESWIS